MNPSSPQLYQPAIVRKVLDQLLENDADLVAFCQDHFPGVRREFSDGMQRSAKVNLLMDRVQPEAIMRVLEEGSSDELRQILATISPVSADSTDTDEGLEHARSKYLSWCIRVHGRMQVAALESGDAQRLLSNATLDEYYVEPFLLADRHFVEKEDEAQRIRSDLRKRDLPDTDRDQLERRLDRLEQDRWEGPRWDAQADYLNVAGLLSGNRHTVVVGAPGSGKTSLLRYLAWAGAQPAPERVRRTGISETVMPLLVPLSNLGRWLDASEDPRLEEVVFRGLPFDDVALRVTFKESLKAGTLLLLLDALDEVPTEDRREAVRRALQDFLSRYPDVRCVITTRPYGYHAITGDIAHLRIAPMPPDQQRQFLTKRAVALSKRRGASGDNLARQKAQETARQIESHASVSQLATNPLLLLMIWEVCQSGATLPTERAQLYYTATNNLLERWNSWRSLGQVRSEQASLPAEKLRSALAQIALQKREQKRDVLHKENLIRWLAAVLRKRGLAAPDQQARSYMDAAADRSGLLEERGPGQFVFWHQTFEEYLAALALIEAAEADEDRLLSISVEPRFREVFQLALGHIALVIGDTERAHRLVQALLRRAGPPRDQTFLVGLRIAAHCVAEQSWIEPALANEILCTLSASVLRLPYAPIIADLAAAFRGRPRLCASPQLQQLLFELLTADEKSPLSEPSLQRAALRIFINAKAATPEALRVLRGFMVAEHSGDLRGLAAVGLLQKGQHEAAVLIALSAYSGSDSALIDELQRALRNKQSLLDPMLQDWLAKEEPGLAECAAILLAHLGSDDGRVAGHLLRIAKRRKDDYPRFGQNGTIEVLLIRNVWQYPAFRMVLLAALGSEQGHQDSVAAEVLLRAASYSDSVLDSLLSALQDHHPGVEPLLVHLGLKDERVLDRLYGLLSCQDLSARFAVIRVLGRLDHAQHPQVRASLVDCLESREPSIRLRAAEFLLGVNHERLWDCVEEARSGTVLWPPSLPDRDRIIAGLRLTLSDPEPKTRASAAVLLVLLQQVDTAVLDVLTDAGFIANSDRRDIAEVLYRMLPRQQQHIQLRLTAQLAHPDLYARRWVLERLNRLRPWGDATVGRLRRALGSSHPLERAMAAMALSEEPSLCSEVARVLIADLLSLDDYEKEKALKKLTKSESLGSDSLELLLQQIEQGQQLAEQSSEETIGQSATRSRFSTDHWLRLACSAAAIHAGRSDAGLDWLAAARLSERPSRRQAAVSVILARGLGAPGEAGEQHAVESIMSRVLVRLRSITDVEQRWLLCRDLRWERGLDEESRAQVLAYYLDHPQEHIRVESAVDLIRYPDLHERSVAVLEAALVSSDLDCQLRAALTLIDRKLHCPALLDTLRRWLSEPGYQLSTRKTAAWDDEPRTRHKELDRRSRFRQQQLQQIRGLLSERLDAQECEGRRLCVWAALWLARICPGDEILRSTLVGWLRHEAALRRLYAVYFLLRIEAWTEEVASEAAAWLDTDDERLRKAATFLLHRSPRWAALVDPRVGQWLASELAAPKDDIRHCDDSVQILGKEVVRAIASHAIREPFDLGRRQDRVWKTILRRRSRRARLVAALSAELDQDDLESRARAATYLYMLGRRSNRVLEVLTLAHLSGNFSRISLGFPLQQSKELEDCSALAMRFPRVREVLKEQLGASEVKQRLSAAALLQEAAEPPTTLAPVLREAIGNDDPHISNNASTILAQLNLPEDRPSLLNFFRDRALAPSLPWWEAKELLRIVQRWPDTKDWQDEVYAGWMEAVLRRSDYEWDWLVAHLAGRVDPQRYRSWLLDCMHRAGPRTAVAAFEQFQSMEPQSSELLSVALRWLADSEKPYECNRRGCSYLLSHGLLPENATDALSSNWQQRDLQLDSPARTLLTLAKDRRVASLMVTLADEGSESARQAVCKLRDGQPVQPSDVAALVALLTVRPTDSFATRFARTWLFYWAESQRWVDEQLSAAN